MPTLPINARGYGSLRSQGRRKAFSRHGFVRGLPFRLRPQNQEGAGKTGCALHPRSHVRCASKKNAAHEHTGEAEAVRPSLRNGSTTYTRSPWRPGFLVTIARVMREHHRELDATLGASGPHAFIVRVPRLRHHATLVHRSPHLVS